jgi:hypothetical protein
VTAADDHYAALGHAVANGVPVLVVVGDRLHAIEWEWAGPPPCTDGTMLDTDLGQVVVRCLVNARQR